MLRVSRDILIINDMGVLFGSGIKLNIHMVPIDNHHLSDINFQVEVYTNQGPNKVVVDKKEAFRIDNDNYIVCIDTLELGYGEMMLTLWADIPDADFPSGIRREGKTIKTNIIIDRR